MYSFLYQNIMIGYSEFECGDPPMGCVSGVLRLELQVSEFINLIDSLGGNNEGGIIRLPLSKEFRVINSDQKVLEYMGGYISVCSDLNEIVLELVGIGYPEYENLFPHHVNSYQQQFSDSELKN